MGMRCFAAMEPLTILTFTLALAAFAALGMDAAFRVAGRPNRGLSVATALLALSHVVLVWHVRYDWSLTKALDHGTAVFVLFHIVLALLLVVPWLSNEIAERIAPATFALVSIAAVPAPFRYADVAPFRIPMTLLFVALLVGIGCARSQASKRSVQSLPVIGTKRSALFTLGQSWRPEIEGEFRETQVTVHFRDGILDVVADMVDDDVFSDATAHNQRTWELGDAFEVFVRREDSLAYTEVHLTPNDKKLHLRFDDEEHHKRIDGIDSVVADPGRIDGRAERTDDGWRARVRIPFDARPGDVLAVSFCRYDATRGREPVLSSSSPHPVLAFHRPLEWARVRIVD
ncbi:MAG: hypothetical protein KDC95_17735 [Planctomycetes bacterium]|nr:hypothetical protein [Planctomycetota bacterium]